MTHPVELHDDHPHGLAHDMEAIQRFNRRRALGLMGAAGGAALLVGCGGDDSSSSSSSSGSATAAPTPTSTATPTPTATSTSSTASCVQYATETNGPYPADGTNQSSGSTSNVLTLSAFQRTDIRSSVIGSSTIADGVELTLTLTLADVNNSCTALSGYAVYVWHCDAAGKYSLYSVPSETYLRGIGVTDENGQITFTTIVPGCYSGRYPHIHFEVFSSLANAVSGNYAVLISQLAIPSDVCSTVYAAEATTYANSASNFSQVSISSDNVFGDNTSAQKEAMTPTMSGSVSAGYTASAVVGIVT